MYQSEDKMVSNPSHYQTKSGLEAIDVIKAFTEDLTGYEAVATANVLRYILRWKKKNGIQDIEKVIWYATDLLEYLKGLKKPEEHEPFNINTSTPPFNPEGIDDPILSRMMHNQLR